MRIDIFIIAVILASFSCAQEEAVKTPDNLIPEEDFVEVLVDLNLIEAVRSMHISKENKDKVETELFYSELWERQNISEEQFLLSFEYYRKDPDKMAEFYKQAAELIKRKEDLLNEEKRNADSPKGTQTQE